MSNHMIMIAPFIHAQHSHKYRITAHTWLLLYRILVQVCFWPFLSNMRLQFQINLETHLPPYNHCPSNRINYTYIQHINEQNALSKVQ